jgi:SAM-dependent methyltransferase
MTNPRFSTGAPKCPYCQALSKPAFQHGEEQMTACASCGAWFVWPPPTAAEIFEHYDRNVAGMPAELRKNRSDTSQEKWYELLARGIKHRVNRDDIRTIIDVGAGGLELTVSLAREFPRARVEAWDLFADGIDRPIPSDISGRISLHRIDLNQLDSEAAPRGSFDVVACVAVIEHVLDPLALLRFLHSMTAPAGFAYVVGPEVTALAHRLLRRSWPYYCPDEHLTIPSLASIRRAMAITGASRYHLRRVNVHYSLKYLLRYLRVPIHLPAAADVLVPVPAGAFELVWEKS